MKNGIISLIGTAIIPFLTGCVSGPTALKSVGPDATSSVEPTLQGRLLVYSATQVGEDFIRGSFVQLTGYEIKDASGKRVAFVPDQDFGAGGSPDPVTLPPGTYNIVAESADYGLVTVPAVVLSGRTTTMHLDRDARTPSPLFPKPLVHSSEEENVGWNGSSN
jgi:hypothetical protein